MRALDEYQRAFYDYSAAISHEASTALYYCNRGLCLRKVGALIQYCTLAQSPQLRRFSEALQDLGRAIDIEPENVRFHQVEIDCGFTDE